MPKTHAGGRPKTSLVWDYFDKDIDNNCSTCTVEKFTGGKAVKCGEKILSSVIMSLLDLSCVTVDF